MRVNIMNRISFKHLFITACLPLMLVACSSGDNQVAGIGGTGITSSGTVTGFGSIFVNGVEFETTGATITLDDNTSATESELALGMIVTVTGEIDDSGNTGQADSVEFDDSIEGPITGPITPDADGQTKSFSILGQTVVVDNSTTVFEDTSFNLIAADDVVEVSGFIDAAGAIIATRLEKKSDLSGGSAEVELKGLISNLDTVARSFSIGTASVTYSPAPVTEFDDMAENDLADGLFVEVEGDYDAGTDIISARKIERESEGFGDDVDKVSIEGLITDYVSDSDFKVQGQAVDASNAEFEPSTLMLADGVKVEVEGPIEGGILKAIEVESEDGELKFEASISLIDNNEITLSYPAPPLTGGAQQLVSVTVNSGTKLEVDGTNTFEEALAALDVGDFVKVEAIDNGSGFVATELKRESDGDFTITGPLDENATQDALGSSDGSVKILGVLVKTDSNTRFEGEDDMPLTADDFFAAANAAVIVKVKDQNPGDGVAEEVEFED